MLSVTLAKTLRVLPANYDLHYFLSVTRCMNYVFTTQITVTIMW